MAVTIMDALWRMLEARRTERFLDSFDEAPICECLTLPYTDPCTLCVEHGYSRNIRWGYRPPRETAVMLGIAVAEGPTAEVCTCSSVPITEACPGCSSRGFATNETAVLA